MFFCSSTSRRFESHTEVDRQKTVIRGEADREVLRDSRNKVSLERLLLTPRNAFPTSILLQLVSQACSADQPVLYVLYW